MRTAEQAREWVARLTPSQPEYGQDGEPVSAVDWLGNRFHLGDRVIYCIGADRGQMMALGTVAQIKLKHMVCRYYSPATADTPAAVYIPFSDTWQTWHGLPYLQVHVKVHTEKTSGRRDDTKRRRTAWVNAMNITALPVVET